MNKPSFNHIVLATQLVYQIPSLSSELKVYWSKILTTLYKDVLSKSEIQSFESKGILSKTTLDYRKINNYASSEEAFTCLALVKFLILEAEKSQDHSCKKHIELFLNETTLALGLENESKKIQETFQKLQQKIADEKNKPEILIPASINLLYVDFAIRCLLLSTFSFLTENDNDNTPWFWLPQFLFLPILIFALSSFKERKDKKANKTLFERFGGIEKYKIKLIHNARQYTMLTIMFIIGVSVSYLLELSIPLSITSFVLLAVYYTLFLKVFNIGRVSENNLLSQISIFKQGNRILEAHEIEEEMVRLESDLVATTSRLETYVFESALFGALTFSGFLQIMAENLITFQDLEKFANHIYEMSFSLVRLDWTNVMNELSLLNTKTNLFCLVSMETLFCSILFLGVIASRLKYSDVADGVRHALNIIKINKKSNVKEGLMDNLEIAQDGMKKVLPIVNYMRYFRMAGILTFQIILISSSFFVSGALAIVFVLMGLSSVLYFNQKYLVKNFEINLILIRNFVLNNGSIIFITSILLMVLAFILRTIFHIEETDYLIVAGLAIFGVYSFIYFILIPQYDEHYAPDNESAQIGLNSSKWKSTTRIIGFSIVLLSLGLILKFLYFPGDNEIITISIFVLLIAWILAGYYLVSIKWFGIICGFLLSVASLFFNFYFLSLPGVYILFTIFIVGQILIFIFSFFRRRFFHKLYLKISLFILLSSTVLFIGALEYMTIAYDHQTISFEETGEINDLLIEYSLFQDTFGDEKATQESLNNIIEDTDVYLDKYIDRYGFTRAVDEINKRLKFMAFVTIDSSFSTHFENLEEQLGLALIAAKQSNKIGKLLNFEPDSFSGITAEAEILVKLGRPEEARLSLNNILKLNPPKEIKEIVNKYLEEMDGGEEEVEGD